MTTRELRVLISGLPPDSQMRRAMNGSGWDDIHYLTADLLDTVAAGAASTAGAAASQKPKFPKPYPRPNPPEEEPDIDPDLVAEMDETRDRIFAGR